MKLLLVAKQLDNKKIGVTKARWSSAAVSSHATEGVSFHFIPLCIGICGSNDDETGVLFSSSSTRVCFSLRAGHCRRVVLLCKVGDVVP